MKTVVIVGASDKPDRFAYKAFSMLREAGYSVLPVHPQLKHIEGIPVISRLNLIKDKVFAVTLYINPSRLGPLVPEIKRLHPERIIFNPGTESEEIEQDLQNEGITVVEGCTLVLLRTGRFETAV